MNKAFGGVVLNRKASKIYGGYIYDEFFASFALIVERLNLLSSGAIDKSFKTILRINKVACVRAILLENIHRTLTAKEIVDIAAQKYGNRKVNVSSVYSEYNAHRDWYERDILEGTVYTPFIFKVRKEAFVEIWDKVFRDDWMEAAA